MITSLILNDDPNIKLNHVLCFESLLFFIIIIMMCTYSIDREKKK